MPRPRTATDGEILQGAARAISRVGPARLTLTEVGREVGLSPAGLLQRFGSKRGLLLALAERAVGSVDAWFAVARDQAESPLGALRIAAAEGARHVESPQALANHLAFLQVDLADPEFHQVALDGARRTRLAYEALLREAVALGELIPCDIGGIARAIQALTSGSLITWAIHRDGSVLDWVRTDLDALIAPYRATTPPARAGGERAAPRARHATRRPTGSYAPSAGTTDTRPSDGPEPNAPPAAPSGVPRR